MDETVKTILLIVGICILLLCGWQAQLVVLGIVILIILYIVLNGHRIGKTEKKQQQRQEHIKNTFPLAYQKFTREHKVRFNYNNWWKSEHLDLFFSVTDNEWALMQQNEETIKKQFLEIEKSAPGGLSYWIKKNNYRVSWNMLGEEIEQFNINGRQIIRREDVIAAKAQILAYEEAYTRIKAFPRWNEEQSHFSEVICELIKIGIPERSYITTKHTVNYTISGVTEEDGRQSFSVYLTFFHPFCLDESLDYSLFPRIKYNSTHIINGFSGETNSIENIEGGYEYYYYLFDEILGHYCFYNYNPFTDSDYIVQEASVILFDEIENIPLDRSHFSLIREYLYEKYKDSEYCTVYQLDEVLSNNAPNLKHNVIIIGHVSSTSKLKEQCEQILSLYPDNPPHLYYISIYQEFSGCEMKGFIEFERRRIAAEEEKKRQEQVLLDSIPTKVQGWEALRGDLHIIYLIDYYPTTVDFDADDEEWDNRWLVWNFKNDPDKTSEKDHRDALDKVIPKFVQLLSDTFGKEALSYLTLVCIPASTQEKNESRYKVFSDELCKRTGMTNGYDYIRIDFDRTAKRDGGKKNNVNYSFDNGYFCGKRVILFDDIITKGDSMRIAKAKLESIGSTIICGLAIGKTRHEHRN